MASDIVAYTVGNGSETGNKIGSSINDLGGNSNGVPPLPIPNREVKPINADGTA